MPYREDSHSPDRKHLERSPSIEPEGRDAPGPSKKPRVAGSNGAMDNQRRQLEKLLRNPDKEVQMPTGPVEKKMRPPPEMVKNVQGSASAAGSGEFHVYKHSRRREYERLKMMETKDKAIKEQMEFLERQAARDAEADAKTAKNRAKRQKRKQGRKGGAGGGGGDEATGAAGGGGDPKRKLAGGGAGVMSASNGNGNGAESASEEDEEAGPKVPVAPAAAAPVSVAPAALEQKEIIIHDDD